MNMKQIKQSWLQGYGYKENGNGAHQKFTDQMAKKTVIKRIFKYLPKTDKFVNVATAISLADEDYPKSDSQSDYLVQLIEGSSYDHDTQKVLITKVYEGITKSEFEKMKNDAQMNTMDPISAGLNYNQSDISTHLKKIPQ